MDWTLTRFPQLRQLVKRKHLFSLMGGFMPIFGPFGRVAGNPNGETMPGIRPLSTAYSPALPGFGGAKTYAAWPVWSGSVAKEIKFQPMPKNAATKLWHRARDFDRQTHQAGKHGGAVGHSALQVLHAMLFDFLNYASGRLDPSYAAIARKANVCQRTVATAIKRLRDLGILNWVRRCAEGRKDGRFVLEQETNAYAVLPATQWRGYRPPMEAPPPHSDTWGATPPLPSLLDQAAAERQHGGTLASMAGILDADPADELAGALARLARAMHVAKS